MEELKKEINDLKKRVAELEKQVQPIEIDRIISHIESHMAEEINNVQGVYNKDTKLITLTPKVSIK
ncbi:hypothetical protein [Clostridium tetani]|uniref:hypothetical protein n=1 Tax=Clostridium tetani TaxID=1513 RepID=UPI000513F169|nr:hypothetical protein [Clostridium tetani]KGI40309.1 hypothetical protein LA33_06535 [Clostridium tetani ATCC 9441]